MAFFLLASGGCRESRTQDPEALPSADPAVSYRPDSVKAVPIPPAAYQETPSPEGADSSLILYYGFSFVDPGGADQTASSLSCREELKRLLPPRSDSVPGRYKAALTQASLLAKAGCLELLPPRRQFALFREPDSATVRWKAVDPEIEVVVSREDAACDIGKTIEVSLKVTLPPPSDSSPLLFASTLIPLPADPVPWSEWIWKWDSRPKLDSAHLPHTDTVPLAGFGASWFREVWLEHRFAWGGGSEELPGMICESISLKVRLPDGRSLLVYRVDGDSGYSYGNAEIHFVQLTDVEGDGDPEFILKDSNGAIQVMGILDGQATSPRTIYQGSTRMLSGC